jgi:hypothetical protein
MAAAIAKIFTFKKNAMHRGFDKTPTREPMLNQDTPAPQKELKFGLPEDHEKILKSSSDFGFTQLSIQTVIYSNWRQQMPQKNQELKPKIRRILPRISPDCYSKLSLIAERRGVNLSELTRSLYGELIEKEFSNQKPASRES